MPDIEVRRDDLPTTRVVELPPGEGSVHLRVDRFALTTNNVTYGAFGEAMEYWRFFPASEEGWGRVPVWGLGEVVTSEVDGIAAGERFYGYFPMSSQLRVVAQAAGGGFVADDEHRRKLPPVYNQYLRVAPDVTRVDEMLLLRPLFGTAFLIAAHLGEGEEAVVLGSASSKTAYGLAHLLSGRRPVFGLTSERNREFVESLDLYDRVLTYDEADALGEETLIYVDMSGDATVREAVHRGAAPRLRRSILVGATHRDRLQDASGATGPAPEFFFAPTYLQRLTNELGAQELQRQMGEAWSGLLERLGDWLEIEHHEGLEAARPVWSALAEGDVDPRKGHVVLLDR
jgi:hypothetical protein